MQGGHRTQESGVGSQFRVELSIATISKYKIPEYFQIFVSLFLLIYFPTLEEILSGRDLFIK
jgi:hypothetical protein